MTYTCMPAAAVWPPAAVPNPMMITGYASSGGTGVGEAGDGEPQEVSAAGAGAAVEDPAGLSRGQLDRLIDRLRRKRTASPPAAVRQPPPRAARQPDAGPYALSFSQQRLWFLSQLDALSPAYNMAGALDLRGPLDRRALGCAVEAGVGRHDGPRAVPGDRSAGACGPARGRSRGAPAERRGGGDAAARGRRVQAAVRP